MPKKRKTGVCTAESTRSTSRTLGECNLELLEKQEYCDVFFIVENEKIGCHKLFLMARSTVFQSMFADRWNNNDKSEVEIVDFGAREFRLFLKFIYADRFVNTMSEAIELLALADKYDVPLLMEKCKELMQSQITLKESVNVYQVARRYNLVLLQKSAYELMTRNFEDLVKLESFHSQADEDTVTALIKAVSLPVSELEVFQSIMRWKITKNVPPSSLKNIMQHVRFPLMSPDEFTSHVVPTKVLTNEEVISVYTSFHSDPKARIDLMPKFSSLPRMIPVDFFADFYGGQVCARVYVMSKTVENHEETQRFQYAFNSSVSGVKAYSICSIVLKGPNPIPLQSGYISSPTVPTKQDTWKVTVTIRVDSETTGPVFEKSNVTISNMSETTVLVYPSVQLVHGSSYYVTIKYHSSVGLTCFQHGCNMSPQNFRTINTQAAVAADGYVNGCGLYSSSNGSVSKSQIKSHAETTFCIRKLGLKKNIYLH